VTSLNARTAGFVSCKKKKTQLFSMSKTKLIFLINVWLNIIYELNHHSLKRACSNWILDVSFYMVIRICYQNVQCVSIYIYTSFSSSSLFCRPVIFFFLCKQRRRRGGSVLDRDAHNFFCYLEFWMEELNTNKCIALSKNKIEACNNKN